MNIAVIPARGGSKRIPHKNIKLFADRPVIAYAIESAKASGLFDHVVVSTEDDEIARVAREYGAETPFKRPDELADDHTPTVPVVAHAIRTCQNLGWDVELVCCIYPCVPLIQIDDLKAAMEHLKVSGAAYSFPVAEFPSPIQRALRRSNVGTMSPFYPQHELARTQDLEPAYYDAGQFYWGTRQSWLTVTHLHSNGAGLVIPKWRAVDIDTPEDWRQAETIFHILRDRQ